MRDNSVSNIELSLIAFKKKEREATSLLHEVKW